MPATLHETLLKMPLLIGNRAMLNSLGEESQVMASSNQLCLIQKIQRTHPARIIKELLQLGQKLLSTILSTATNFQRFYSQKII
jgi:hypothetical protein